MTSLQQQPVNYVTQGCTTNRSTSTAMEKYAKTVFKLGVSVAIKKSRKSTRRLAIYEKSNLHYTRGAVLRRGRAGAEGGRGPSAPDRHACPPPN